MVARLRWAGAHNNTNICFEKDRSQQWREFDEPFIKRPLAIEAAAIRNDPSVYLSFCCQNAYKNAIFLKLSNFELLMTYKKSYTWAFQRTHS